MKTLAAVTLAGFLGLALGHAHEKHEHPAGPGAFGKPPEYVHVLLNPLPVYGLGIGILALAGALIARSKPAQVVALGIIVLGSSSAWPVAQYGENAYARIQEQADDAGQQWLDEHMERAEKLVYLFYGAALLGVAALVSRKKFPKAWTPLVIATLVVSAAAAGAGAWIGKAGAQIRHPEFRAKAARSASGGGFAQAQGGLAMGLR